MLDDSELDSLIAEALDEALQREPARALSDEQLMDFASGLGDPEGRQAIQLDLDRSPIHASTFSLIAEASAGVKNLHDSLWGWSGPIRYGLNLLSPEVAEKFKAHLDHCSRCSKRVIGSKVHSMTRLTLISSVPSFLIGAVVASTWFRTTIPQPQIEPPTLPSSHERSLDGLNPTFGSSSLDYLQSWIAPGPAREASALSLWQSLPQEMALVKAAGQLEVLRRSLSHLKPGPEQNQVLDQLREAKRQLELAQRGLP